MWTSTSWRHAWVLRIRPDQIRSDRREGSPSRYSTCILYILYII
jgi:hypothetical protein